MNYYQCSIEALRRELQRRVQATHGSHDQLSERLQSDDEQRGSEATTVTTETVSAITPRVVISLRARGYGQPFAAAQLVGQRIICWDLNTFHPILQLFFESGLSCTVDGSQLSGALVGLDPILRYRLTDCAHEEQGQVRKSIMPERFTRSSARIMILEATIARRTSIRVKPARVSAGELLISNAQELVIMQEVHTVIGLRLSGMSRMGCVWAKTEMPVSTTEDRLWGDVRLVGLRDDVPAPILGLPADFLSAAGEVKVVEKGSMLKLPSTPARSVENLGRPWI
ncbi:hypothetical protein SVAN01_02399 [Stagonosporopsis vannaccii]|nr:hypothetical protein SVAN01_02399 [Stagonosporopsis vannaccii]